MSQKYITTALPYLNGAPHIGHALDFLLADVYSRYHTKQGTKVRFQVGTDEHGNKVFEKAKQNQLEPQDFVDQNAAKFRHFIEKLGVEYTDFVRTTDQEHQRRCQQIWQKLSPYIYSADYEGWYCKGCERFVSPSEYHDNPICPDHQTPYQKLSEQNYYLRISDFIPRIKTAIETDEMKIIPSFRKQEILKLLLDTKDVSISRPLAQLSWGIPVPGDHTQVMYVWLDALTSYITVLGYPEQPISDWPAAVQFVGKDILRFHAIIWPAILLGLGLPLPKIIHSHGFILSDNQKMSKSLGNVIDPLAVLDLYGTEPFRYYFLRHIDSFADSDFTVKKYQDSYNNELANDLGNLVQRLANLCRKQNIDTSNLVVEDSTIDFSYYHTLMSEHHFSRAFDFLWQQIQSLNKRIDEEKPWMLVKTDQESAKKSLLRLAQDLLSINHELAVFLPDTSKKISAIFSDPDTPLVPLFPKQ